MATTHGVKDISRKGRTATAARRAGHGVGRHGRDGRGGGWPATTLPGETAADYADYADYAAELTQLTEAITAYRRAESGGGTTTTSRNNPGRWVTPRRGHRAGLQNHPRPRRLTTGHLASSAARKAGAGRSGQVSLQRRGWELRAVIPVPTPAAPRPLLVVPR